MARKKFDKEYLERVDRQLQNVMFKEPGATDWTQFSLSIRDAMLAAATVYGSSADEEKHKLAGLLQELVWDHSVPNIREWDITCRRHVDGKPSEEECSVFLLYECDEWLSTGSMVLMGVFTSEEKLKENAEKMIRQRAKKHLKTAAVNSIYDFENPDNDAENINIVVRGMMAELMNNSQTQGWEVNYLYKCVETDKLEEI